MFILELTDYEAAAISVLVNEAIFDLRDQMFYADRAGEYEEYRLLDQEQMMLERIGNIINIQLMEVT